MSVIQAPAPDCPRCDRLVAFRQANQAQFPGWHNAPVPAFGGDDARLLIVGLAPGLRGANRTGRPFTGDWAGDLLYATLLKYGFARGTYEERPDDGLTLVDCRITNAVRCVPPENKPVGEEIGACRPFLESEIAGLSKLKVLVALGNISHAAILRSLKQRVAAYPFKHGAQYELPNGLVLASSYHCSRYNTNTGRLTTPMFEAVFAGVRKRLGQI